jgi:hypothetical protein
LLARGSLERALPAGCIVYTIQQRWNTENEHEQRPRERERERERGTSRARDERALAERPPRRRARVARRAASSALRYTARGSNLLSSRGLSRDRACDYARAYGTQELSGSNRATIITLVAVMRRRAGASGERERRGRACCYFAYVRRWRVYVSRVSVGVACVYVCARVCV